MRHCLIVLLLTIISACATKEKRVAPFGWTSVDHRFDSLTIALEWSFFDFAPDDELRRLVDDIGREASADQNNNVKKARAMYWRARLNLREGDVESAVREFQKAAEATDSARYPYDIARIEWNTDFDDINTIDDYVRVKRRLKVFENAGDYAMAAADYMALGSFMNDLTDPKAAIGYFDKADSLLRHIGFWAMVVKNDINRANSYANYGDTLLAVETLRRVIADESARRDLIAMNTAMWNLYLYSGDTLMLRESYSIAAADTLAMREQSQCESRLASLMARQGDARLAMAYARSAKSKSAFIDNWEDYKHYYLGQGDALLAAGRGDAAAENYRKAVEMADSTIADKRVADVAAMELRDEIAKLDYNEALRQTRRTVAWLVIVVIVVVVSSITLLAMRRKINLQKIAIMRKEFEREHSNKKLMAMQIAMKETHELIDSISDAARRLTRSGVMTEEAAATITNAIKTHLAASDSRDSFITTFSEMHPAFFSNLANRYPGLSETERRLCVYIALGLDTKHIARLLSVRPESVKQARWRLKGKMNLNSAVSLEDAIKELSEMNLP